MKVRMICTWDNEIKYSVKFKNEERGIIIREIHRYRYAIHCISIRIIELPIKSIWSI